MSEVSDENGIAKCAGCWMPIEQCQCDCVCADCQMPFSECDCSFYENECRDCGLDVHDCRCDWDI
mgnify:CR=1 FL=1